MLHLLFAVGAFPPGTPRGVFNFSTSLCSDASPATAPGTCFAAFGHHPATLCRQPDPNCSTMQRVATMLSTYHRSEVCTTYGWLWSCAVVERIACGPLWCDAASICIENATCVCPEGMDGDAVWQSCNCPPLQVRNGTECVGLPNCTVWDDDKLGNFTTPAPTVQPSITPLTTTTPTVSPVTPSRSAAEADCSIVDDLLGFILTAFGCMCLGLALGLWYGVFYMNNNTVHPEPVYNTLDRVRQNQMYVPTAPSENAELPH